MPRMVLLAPSQTHGNAAGGLNGSYRFDTLATTTVLRHSRLPSIFVQLFWSAVVGPWILWKIRNVNDVHSWAWQTKLAIFAGLVSAGFGFFVS